MLMKPNEKKEAVDIILSGLKKSSGDEVMEQNEQAMLEPTNEDGDSVDAKDAMDAAAASAMNAIQSGDIQMFKSALMDIFQLMELTEPEEKED